MEVKSKIFKRKAGKSKDKWIVRIDYFDALKGKNRCVERQTERKNEAVDLRDKLVSDVKKSHGQITTGERMTFDQLVDVCEKTFYKPAEIIEGRKVTGLRSYDNAVKYQIKRLRSYFSKLLINEITTESLTAYKMWRLKNDSERLNRPVKIATVNRELAAMRKMMRFAYGKGWLLRDIFFNAGVIETSAEVERTRLLTQAEEIRLLSACQGERQVIYKRKIKGKEKNISATFSLDNPHLKAIILLAIDSGMRRGEILKLRWQDFDFENNNIRILGTHTKTERERLAPLSQRTKDELNRLRKFTSGEKPFPFADFKRSFATAKRIAGINDLHFHDLRRTAITRWQKHISLALAGKLAGHSQLQTTLKHYTSTDVESVREISERMNTLHAQNEDALASEMVN